MRDNQERRKDLRRDNAQRRPFAAAEERDDADNILEGRNALTEALASGRAIDKVFIAEGNTDRALARLAAQARQSGAVVVETDRRKLDQMSATGAHQGIIAMVAAHSYATVDDILALARERGEAPLIVICDELSDPHNLGAIIRTAECAGAHGVIIPKRRSVGLTAVVGKASAGALEYLPVARVSNVTAAIKELKAQGVNTLVFRTQLRETALNIDSMLSLGVDDTLFVLTHSGESAELTVGGFAHNELLH